MLDRVLSSRRVTSHLDDPDTDASADDSKTKKQNLSLLASNYLSRLSHFCFCPTASLLLCLLLAIVLITSLAFHSRSFVCVSDPGSRVGFFGLDGLESDFGSLGVPWCKSLSHLAFDEFIYLCICNCCLNLIRVSGSESDLVLLIGWRLRRYGSWVWLFPFGGWENVGIINMRNYKEIYFLSSWLGSINGFVIKNENWKWGFLVLIWNLSSIWLSVKLQHWHQTWLIVQRCCLWVHQAGISSLGCMFLVIAILHFAGLFSWRLLNLV
jgi:hypothetical protein